MLKNYFEIDKDMNLSGFLKEVKDKKNSHYIILNTEPETFVDIRTIALKLSNPNEKLKGFQKKLISSDDNTHTKLLNVLLDSGDRVIKSWDGYYDFVDALQSIIDLDPDFIHEPISSIAKKEIYALNEDDKISQARKLFLEKRINLLPIINQLDIIGELRPIDFLVTNLFETESSNNDYYNPKHKENVLNTPINNLANNRPLTINKDKKIKDLMEILIKKKLPSLIITDDDNKLYSITSYKDVFRLYKKDLDQNKYSIEYVGGGEIYEDEFDLIKDFAERTMKKISKISDYNNLKITIKLIGEKDTSHQRKAHFKLLLSEGKNIIQVEKEMVSGTSDEEFNDKIKGKWNIPQTLQQALNTLEKKVKDEKRKNN